MKSWRIHLLWLAVSVTGAAAWGRYVALRTERDLRERARESRPRSAAEAALPAAPPRADLSLRAEPALPPADAPAPSGPEPMTPDRIRALLRDRQESAKALRAIEALEDRALKLALIREALGLPDQKARWQALGILARMGGPEASELLVEVLRTGEPPALRVRAASALEKSAAPGAVEALLEGTRSGSNELQAACARSLGRLGHAGPTAELISKFAGSLESPDGAVRRQSIELLADLESPAAIPHLARGLRDSSGDVRTAAVFGLEALAVPEVIPLLEGAAADPNPAVAEEAKGAVLRLRKALQPKRP